jgi:plastocyanin
MKPLLILSMILGLMAGPVATAEAQRAETAVSGMIASLAGAGTLKRDAVAGPVRMLAAVRGHTYYPSFGPDGVVVARHGSGLDLLNLDEHAHTLTSVAWRNGMRLFDSRSIAQGKSRGVRGVEKLAMGRYRFFCTSHPEMRGILEVRHI